MKHFCTFGNTPNYINTLTRLYHQAAKSGYFDTISIYDQNNTPGIQDHVDFIKSHPRGFGYWIWKPMVILDVMNKASPNDIIIYADAGCSIYNTEDAKGLLFKVNTYIEDKIKEVQ